MAAHKRYLLWLWSVLAPSLVCGTMAHADISFSIGGAVLQTTSLSVKLPAGSLIELVNLGADGLFNPIQLNDGGSDWVSGDDSTVAFAYTVGTSAGDFPSAAAFDLEVGPDTPGMLERTFTFAVGTLTVGSKLGIRWFPGLQASQYQSLSGPAPGQAYGQFTRQSAPVNGGDLWVVPGDGAAVDFDPLVTASFGGNDPNSAGVASFFVVPEPGCEMLLVFGGLALLGQRARHRATRRI